MRMSGGVVATRHLPLGLGCPAARFDPATLTRPFIPFTSTYTN